MSQELFNGKELMQKLNPIHFFQQTYGLAISYQTLAGLVSSMKAKLTPEKVFKAGQEATKIAKTHLEQLKILKEAAMLRAQVLRLQELELKQLVLEKSEYSDRFKQLEAKLELMKTDKTQTLNPEEMKLFEGPYQAHLEELDELKRLRESVPSEYKVRITKGIEELRTKDDFVEQSTFLRKTTVDREQVQKELEFLNGKEQMFNQRLAYIEEKVGTEGKSEVFVDAVKNNKDKQFLDNFTEEFIQSEAEIKAYMKDNYDIDYDKTILGQAPSHGATTFGGGPTSQNNAPPQNETPPPNEIPIEQRPDVTKVTKYDQSGLSHLTAHSETVVEYSDNTHRNGTDSGTETPSDTFQEDKFNQNTKKVKLHARNDEVDPALKIQKTFEIDLEKPDVVALVDAMDKAGLSEQDQEAIMNQLERIDQEKDAFANFAQGWKDQKGTDFFPENKIRMSTREALQRTSSIATKEEVLRKDLIIKGQGKIPNELIEKLTSSIKTVTTKGINLA